MTVVELEAGTKLHRHRGYSKLRKAEFVELLENRTQTSRKSKTIARKESIRREKNHSPFLLKKKRKIKRLKKKLRTIKQSSKRTKRKKNIKEVN